MSARRLGRPRIAGAAAASMSSSCSSSSIGRDSDSSGGCAAMAAAVRSEEPEVQSRYKGPLDSMDALEDALPGRVHEFHRKMSNAIPILASVAHPSCRDHFHPDNTPTKKRKSTQSLTIMRNKAQSKGVSTESGIAKRSLNFSRTTRSPVGRGSWRSNSSSSSDEEHAQARHLRLQRHRRRVSSAACICSPPANSPSSVLDYPSRSFPAVRSLQDVSESSALISSGTEHRRG